MRGILKRKPNNEMLLRLPHMTDRRKLGAMNMLNLLFFNSFTSGTYHFPFIALRMTGLTLKDGLSAISAVGFALYGILTVGLTNHAMEGYRFGQLALKVTEKFQAREWIPRVNLIVWGALSPWVIPHRQVLKPLLEGYFTGLATGDVEYALLSGNLYCFSSFDLTHSLDQIREEAAGFQKVASSHKHTLAIVMYNRFLALVDAFRGRLTPSDMLNFSSEEKKQVLNRHDLSHIIVRFGQMMVAHAFGRYEIAESHASYCYEEINKLHMASFELCSVQFHAAVILMAVIRQGNCSRAKRRSHLRAVKHVTTLFRRYARDSPRNCSGKHFLLQAELAAYQGNHSRAFAKYTCALSMSESEGFLHEHGIGNEKAALFLLEDRGDQHLAHHYYTKALTTYERWNAHGKVEHLKKTLGLRFLDLEMQTDRIDLLE